MNCNVVLVNPDIPQNTGNIARLTAGLGCQLHVVKPMGFEITDKNVKRAGLDYWPEVKLQVHDNWQAFLADTGAEANQMWFFSTKASNCFTTVTYRPGDYLVYGSETKGLNEWFHHEYPDRRVQIAIENPNIRSFNLSNAVAVGLFEARRCIVTK
ncbi:UNVERIFIED_CONTAM: hypothetical protein GTU68_005229 [Idotea baltica]|nr:hypothetical protein [Idotea baltica]